MTPPPRRRPTAGDDSGAVLVFALVVVTIVSLVVGALLSLSASSLHTTAAVRETNTLTTTADAAAQAAINRINQSAYNNSLPSQPQCFQDATGTYNVGTLMLPDLVPGGAGTAASSAAVQCEVDTSTGASGVGVPITTANKPGNAILTTSTNPAEDGLNVKALNSSLPFAVRGSIYSNSTVNVTSGSLLASNGVYAHSGCSGTIISTPPANCSVGTVTTPSYSTTAAAVPTYRQVPANVSANCPGGVMTFEPGYYDDAKALSDLMDGNGTCKNSVWWFKPGSYYFDFQNASGAVPSMSGTDEWLVKNGQLLAGTPVNAAGTPVAAPVKPISLPGACWNPIKSTAAVGVQFVFGGDSRMQVTGSADAEICGTYSSSAPPIAVYGLPSGTATVTTATDLSATAATGTVTGTATGFTPTPTGGTLAGSAAVAGDGKADVFTTAATAGTATLTLSPFVPTGGVPAGSVLTSAKLRVVYGTSAAATARSLTITPSSSAGPGTAVTPAVSTAAPLVGGAGVGYDLTGSLLESVHTNGLTGLSMLYSTSLAAGKSEAVDAVLLDLTYRVPSSRATSGCLLAPYTGGSAGQCAVLSTTSSYSGRFYVQGTTYAPAAPIDITLSNVTAQVLRFGVISRVLWLKETGAVSYSGPVIELPDDSPGYGPGGTVVRLTAFVCEKASTCRTPTDTSPAHSAWPVGRLLLRVRVYVFDPTGTPVVGGRQMVVQSWAAVR